MADNRICAEWNWSPQDCPWNIKEDEDRCLNLEWALTCLEMGQKYSHEAIGSMPGGRENIPDFFKGTIFSASDKPRMMISAQRTGEFLYGDKANLVYHLWAFLWESGKNLFRWHETKSRRTLFPEPGRAEKEIYYLLSWWLQLEWMRRMNEECYMDRKEMGESGKEKYLTSDTSYLKDNWRFGSRDNLIHTILVAFIGDTILNASKYDKNVKKNFLSEAAYALKQNSKSQEYIEAFLKNRIGNNRELNNLYQDIDIKFKNEDEFDINTLKEIVRAAWQIAALLHDSGYALAFMQLVSENFWGQYNVKEILPPILKDIATTNPISLINYTRMVKESSPELNNGDSKWTELNRDIENLCSKYMQKERKNFIQNENIIQEDKRRYHEIWSSALIIHLMEKGLENMIKENESKETKKVWVAASLLASRSVLKHHSKAKDKKEKLWNFEEDPIGYLLRAVDDTQDACRTLYGPAASAHPQKTSKGELFPGISSKIKIQKEAVEEIVIVRLYPEVRVYLSQDNKGWHFLLKDNIREGYRPPKDKHEKKKKKWRREEYNPMFECDNPSLKFDVKIKFCENLQN